MEGELEIQCSVQMNREKHGIIANLKFLRVAVTPHKGEDKSGKWLVNQAPQRRKLTGMRQER